VHLIVHERRDESDGVVSLTLRHPAGAALPAWTAGAHVDVVLDEGLVRQYSLSSDPHDRHRWRLGVLREQRGRGGSDYACTKLDVGDTVEVSEPRNHFTLEPAAHYLFLAGGIGITPILAMIAHAEAVGASWTLLYGGRTRAAMAFRDELAAFGERVTLAPQDEVGLLPLTDLLAEPRPDTLVYGCGPEPMLAALEREIGHWPAGSLHVERFAPKAVETDRHEEAFEVEFARTGITALVPPGRSILDIAGDAGVPAPFSCTEGTCGTCETTIIEGRAEHRDSVLEDHEREENACLMICVSRAEPGCPRLRLEL